MNNRQFKIKLFRNPGVSNLPQTVEVVVSAFTSHDAKKIAENGNRGYRATFATEIKEPRARKESSSGSSGGAHTRSSHVDNLGCAGILKWLITLSALMIALLLINKCSAPGESAATSTQLPAPETPSIAVEPQKDQVQASVVDFDATPSESAKAVTASKSRALIVDSRERIVLQSGPKMSSKNVAKVDTGSEVEVLSRSGKWVEVRTAGGLVGFVRQSQLVLLD